MTSQQSLQLFDIVNRNFKTETDARLFVTEIDTLISSSFKDEASDLSTQKDLDVVKNELLKEIAITNKEISIINKETALIRSELTKEIIIVKSELTKQIDATRADLTKQIDVTRAELTKQIDLTRADLIKQMDTNKYDLIKWTFSFWVTIILLIVGGFFLRK